MPPPKVESSNTRFYVLLALGAIATIAWYLMRGSWSLPSLDTVNMPSFDATWLIVPLILGVMIVKAINIAAKQIPEENDEPLYIEENDPTYRSEEEPVLIDEPKQWEDMPVRERAQIIGWVSLLLGFFFYPIGSIIGLIMLRGYHGSDSTIVTVARVLLVLILVSSLALFAPLILAIYAT